MKTKVYLVGAGPGDPKLLTLRAKELLERADAVIYDALVSEAIKALLPQKAELIYVGKRARRHSLSQEEINDLILETAQRLGGIIVRLKGGDPFVFGRGGEEMIALKAAGIPYEIVPGISAGLAAPAYYGIPVTHRGLSRSVSLITATSMEGNLPELDWQSWAQVGGSLVFYMGMRAVPEIARQLIAHGMARETPAAIISQGTTPRQQLLGQPLELFAQNGAGYSHLSPGLFLVGEVISFARDYAPLEEKPLWGQRVVVTRALAQSSKLADLLQEAGAEVSFLPTIEIHEREDLSALDLALSDILSYSWVIFTSSNAVEIFFGHLAQLQLDARALSHCRFAVVGPQTAQRLRDYGIRADFMPQKHTAKALCSELLEQFHLARTDQVLLPTSAIAHRDLVAGLEAAGIPYQQLAIYENRSIPYTREYLEEQLKGGAWITFCSSSAVDHLMQLLGEHQLEGLLPQLKIAAIGEVTAKALHTYQLSPLVMPQRALMEELVEEIIQYTINNKA